MSGKTIRFGIIGLGLMGREFGSAVARWCHLLDLDFTPQITAVCDINPKLLAWFQSHFDTIQVATSDYHDLLDSNAVDAIYCAVPHNLHAEMYGDIIRAGKHLMGEKPFGIDLDANWSILDILEAHPRVFAACSSEMPFFPGAQRVIQMIRENTFGKIIEVEAAFFHSSDLDPHKKMNWKRMASINGEYGVMGDLGIHVLHIPLRFGWMPQRVAARLSNIFPERLNDEGKKVPCDTWDNAIIDGWVEQDGQEFPLTLRTYRIAPGETNTWSIRIAGTSASVEFSTKYPKTLRRMRYSAGQEQAWEVLDLGYQSAYPTITGGIFEFGFPDALLQMWAAFCDELSNGRAGMRQPFYCATPAETYQHHRVLTAALQAHSQQQVIRLGET